MSRDDASAGVRVDDPPLFDAPAPRWAGPLVIGVGIALGVAVLAHMPGLNGPWYWKWAYARMWPGPVYIGFALAAAPLLIALALYELGRVGTRTVLIAAAVSAFALRLAWMVARSPRLDLGYMVYAVRHPLIVSYYNDAAALSNFPGWLEHFDQVMGELSSHSRNKPAGPILFCYAFIKTFGDSWRTGLITGLVLGVLQAISVFATWFFLNVLTRNRRAAIMGACYLALCPGTIVFFPLFDSLYILLVAPMVALWMLALERDRWVLAVATGLALWVCTLLTFNFLVIGFFMVGCGLLATGRRPGAALLVMLRQSIVVLGTLVAAYFLLFAISGYNPVRTFGSALDHQRYLLSLPTVVRPYPATVLFDLTDFALGSAWISFLLAGLWIMHALKHDACARAKRIVLLGIAQLLVVAATALLPGETARVWNFLYPLLMLPVGLELTRMSAPMRYGIFIVELFILATLAQNMVFI